MVAHNHRTKPHFTKLPSANFDPTVIFQGDVSQNDPTLRQEFKIRTAGVIKDPKTGRMVREWLFEDQFHEDGAGNMYLTYRAVCLDGEEYDLGDRLKPSVIARFGGVSSDLLDHFRAKAFFSFAKTDEGIQVLRSVAGNITKSVINAERLLIPGGVNLAN